MHRGFVHIQAEMLRQFHLQQVRTGLLNAHSEVFTLDVYVGIALKIILMS